MTAQTSDRIACTLACTGFVFTFATVYLMLIGPLHVAAGYVTVPQWFALTAVSAIVGIASFLTSERI